MGSHKRRKGSPCCANERLRNARQRDPKTESWVDLPLFAPKIPKIVDQKSATVLKNEFLKFYGALRTFMQNNPIRKNKPILEKTHEN